MEIAFKNDDRVLHENEDMLRYGVGYSDCPIGWGPLVRQLFKDIRDVCKKHNCALPKVAQVKSKFGSLQFYLDNDNPIFKGSPAAEEVNKLIVDAENKSLETCEITGLPGSYYVKNKWYATLQEDMAIELGYTKVPDH